MNNLNIFQAEHIPCGGFHIYKYVVKDMDKEENKEKLKEVSLDRFRKYWPYFFCTFGNIDFFLEKLSDKLEEECARNIMKHPEKEESLRNKLSNYLKEISKKEYKLYHYEIDAIPLSDLKEKECFLEVVKNKVAKLLEDVDKAYDYPWHKYQDQENELCELVGPEQDHYDDTNIVE